MGENKLIDEGLSESQVYEAMDHYISDEKKRENLNDFFNYGLDEGIVHLHVTPTDINPIIQKNGGAQNTMGYINEMLFDALEKVVEIADNDKSIQYVFAVSRLFNIEGGKQLFEMFGFKSSECGIEELKKRFGVNTLFQESIPINVLKQVIEAERNLRESVKDALGKGTTLKDLKFDNGFLVSLQDKYSLLKNRHGEMDGKLWSNFCNSVEDTINYKINMNAHHMKAKQHEDGRDTI